MYGVRHHSQKDEFLKYEWPFPCLMRMRYYVHALYMIHKQTKNKCHTLIKMHLQRNEHIFFTIQFNHHKVVFV